MPKKKAETPDEPVEQEKRGASSVEWRSVEELTPYARNARTHDDRQIEILARSIERFGFNNPVLVDESGEVIAGHGRVLAALQLGMKEVPVVHIEHLSDAEIRAYRLADNRIAEMSEWDVGLLESEMADLDDDLLSGTGMDSLVLGDLSFSDSAEGDEEAEYDPGVPYKRAAKPRFDPSSPKLQQLTLGEDFKYQVSRGDRWVLDNRHELWCLDVFTGHRHYMPFLKDEYLFLPYPSLFAPLTTKADESVLFMVMPDTFIASHMLDVYSQVRPEATVVLSNPPEAADLADDDGAAQ